MKSLSPVHLAVDNSIAYFIKILEFITKYSSSSAPCKYPFSLKIFESLSKLLELALCVKYSHYPHTPPVSPVLASSASGPFYQVECLVPRHFYPTQLYNCGPTSQLFNKYFPQTRNLTLSGQTCYFSFDI